MIPYTKHLLHAVQSNPPSTVDRYYAIEVEAVLCQRASFIKADELDLPTEVHPLGTDAVYLLLPEAVQGVDCTNGEGSGKGRGYHDSDYIQGTVHGLLHLVVLGEADS